MSLPKSIQDTLSYTKYFDFPLTKEELHHWLISSKNISLQKIKFQKINHPYLIKTLNKKRLKRLKISNQKINLARKFVSLAKLIPTINMVALTGSLAMKNAKAKDDIDLMIVTTPNTLWLTRSIIFVLTKLFFNLRKPRTFPSSNSICLNLWLDSTTLKVPAPKQNLYTAHEVLQVKPLFDKANTHKQFVANNSWTKKFLVNAYQEKAKISLPILSRRQNSTNLGVIYWLNSLAFHLQYLYMKNKITSETVTLHTAYFHPRDLSKKILNRVK